MNTNNLNELLPKIKIRRIADHVLGKNGFLWLKKSQLKCIYPNGQESEIFPLDAVHRKSMDAVAILAHHEDKVYLRSCLRPAVGLRFPELGSMWEIAAGLIDKGESPEMAAARETAEELGFNLKPENFKPLGDFIFPSVGHFAERIYLYHVEVDPSSQKEPSEDGSVMERDGKVISVTLSAALGAVRKGEIRDTKTEISLRRFQEGTNYRG